MLVLRLDRTRLWRAVASSNVAIFSVSKSVQRNYSRWVLFSQTQEPITFSITLANECEKYTSINTANILLSLSSQERMKTTWNL